MRALRLLAGLGLVLLALGLCFQRVHDPDLPWHLRAGEEILSRHAVPSADSWSELSLGRPWLDIHWAAQVALALVYRAGGFVLLQTAALGLTLAALALALAAAGGPRPLLALPAAALALLAAEPRLDPRPDLVAHAFPALFLILLDRTAACARDGRSPARWVLALAVASAVWTNLHGSFVLGPLIALAYLAGALLGRAPAPARRALALAPLVVLAATLLNPRGAVAWQLFAPYVHAIAGRFGMAASQPSARIQEWLPTLSTDAAPYMVGVLRPYEALLLLSLLALVAARPEDLGRAAVLVLFGALSVLAIRNVAPFAFVAAAVIPPCLERPLGRLPAGPRRALAWLVPLATAALAFHHAAAFVSNRVFVDRLQAGDVGPGPDPALYPMGACDYLRDHPVAGQVFNSYAAGGYYIWRFAPGRRALVDGRLDLLAPAELDRFVRALRDPGLFEEMARAHGVTHVLLAYAGSDAGPLVRYLEGFEGRGWRRVFADGAAAVWVRAGTAMPAVPGRDAGAVDAAPAGSSLHPWDAAAERLLAPLLARRRHFPTAALNLAYLAEASGDLEPAAASYRRALAEVPEYHHVRGKLADLELRLGHVAAARAQVEWLDTHAPGFPGLEPLRAAIDAATRGDRPGSEPPAPLSPGASPPP